MIKISEEEKEYFDSFTTKVNDLDRKYLGPEGFTDKDLIDGKANKIIDDFIPEMARNLGVVLTENAHLLNAKLDKKIKDIALEDNEEDIKIEGYCFRAPSVHVSIDEPFTVYYSGCLTGGGVGGVLYGWELPIDIELIIRPFFTEIRETS